MKSRYCFRYYSAYDVKGITEFLDRMAAKGWLLKAKSGIAYKFVKTDKPYFKYDITFFADASKENDFLPYGADRYFEMRQAAGWHFVTNDNKMMIFINENPDAPELETEAMVKVDVIHDSYVHFYLFFELLIIFNSATALMRIMDKYKSSLVIEFNDRLLFSVGVIAFLNILSYFIWYFKAKKAAREGWFYQTKTPILQFYVTPLLVAVMIVSMLYVTGWKASIFILAITAIYIAAKGSK